MQTEVEAIAAAMVQYGGNLAMVALSLGITENLLKLKMSAYGLKT
jgi:DNA-binding NtrC family response regulator